MYAAAVHEGTARTESKAAPRILNAWLERAPQALWIDVQEPTAENLVFLRDRFGLHPLAVEECDHTGVRPKIEQFENHLYLVIHGINHNEGEDQLNTVEFKIFLWKDHLITVHDKPSRSIRATQERLQRDARMLVRGGVDDVLHQILDAVVDHYFPILEAMEAQVADMEGRIFRDPSNDLLEEMLNLQRRILTLHRLIHPQLDLLGALASGRYAEIGAGDVAYFRDVYDHLNRINDRVHVAREMLASSMQCYLSQVSNRMNSVMKSLAVLATVSVPATLITSLWGMNLDHLPGKAAPQTFGLALLISLVTSGALVFCFKRLRWL